MNISDDAIEAAADVLDERGPAAASMAERALSAALPHLLPGLYVTRDGRDATIWAERPNNPRWPDALMMRAEANARLFDALAALLPDRTDDETED